MSNINKGIDSLIGSQKTRCDRIKVYESRKFWISMILGLLILVSIITCALYCGYVIAGIRTVYSNKILKRFLIDQGGITVISIELGALFSLFISRVILHAICDITISQISRDILLEEQTKAMSSQKASSSDTQSDHAFTADDPVMLRLDRLETEMMKLRGQKEG